MISFTALTRLWLRIPVSCLDKHQPLVSLFARQLVPFRVTNGHPYSVRWASGPKIPKQWPRLRIDRSSLQIQAILSWLDLSDSHLMSSTHTSYHGFTPNDIRWLQQQAIRLVIGRHWIQQQHLSPIFRWLRIAPLTDPAVCLTVSVLGLYVRRGG